MVNDPRQLRGGLSPVLSFAFWSSSLLLAAQILAAFALPEHLWGLHHLAFMPTSLTITLVSAILLLLVLARYGSETWIGQGYLHLRRLPKPVLFGGGLLVALALFYFFRLQHLLLGDAAIVNQLEQTPPGFSWLGKNDPLVHYLLYDLVAHLFPLKIWSVFGLVSCVAGVLFVAAAIGVASTGGKHRGSRLFILGSPQKTDYKAR